MAAETRAHMHGGRTLISCALKEACWELLELGVVWQVIRERRGQDNFHPL